MMPTYTSAAQAPGVIGLTSNCSNGKHPMIPMSIEDYYLVTTNLVHVYPTNITQNLKTWEDRR
jgi:hypothetical protein